MTEINYFLPADIYWKILLAKLNNKNIFIFASVPYAKPPTYHPFNWRVCNYPHDKFVLQSIVESDMIALHM